MSKFKLGLIAFMFIVCSGAMAATVSGHSVLLTIVNPTSWGLDSAISSVIGAAALFLIGLFTKSPRSKK